MKLRILVAATALVAAVGGAPRADAAAPARARPDVTAFHATGVVHVPAFETLWVSCRTVLTDEDSVVATADVDARGEGGLAFLAGGESWAGGHVGANEFWRRLPSTGFPGTFTVSHGVQHDVDRDVRTAWAIMGTTGTCVTSVGVEPVYPGAGGDPGVPVDPSRATVAYVSDLKSLVGVRAGPVGLTTPGTLDVDADGWFAGLVVLQSSVGSSGIVRVTRPDGRVSTELGGMRITELDSHGRWTFQITGAQGMAAPVIVALNVPNG